MINCSNELKNFVAKSFDKNVADKLIVYPSNCTNGFMSMTNDGKGFVFANRDYDFTPIILSVDDLMLYFGDYTSPDILMSFAAGKTVSIPRCNNIRIGYRYYNLPERSFNIKTVYESLKWRYESAVIDYTAIIDHFVNICSNHKNSGQNVPALNDGPKSINVIYGILRSYAGVDKVIFYSSDERRHGIDSDTIRIPIVENKDTLTFTSAVSKDNGRMTTYVKVEGSRDAMVNYEVAYCYKDSVGRKEYNLGADEQHVHECFGNIIAKETVQAKNMAAFERALQN